MKIPLEFQLMLSKKKGLPLSRLLTRIKETDHSEVARKVCIAIALSLIHI